ncbi:hypothetical protein [Rhodopseudomonas palustris]|uniref:hypothetical protein n=1 Tax=Rhodopseudomonas palustris TaxID=1076 RepID=UPI00131B4C90|nr:hypothetical protein [Rhodopseudomonas palustris]
MRAARALTTTIGVRRAATARAASRTTGTRARTTGSCAGTTGPGTTTRAATRTTAATTALGHHLARAKRQHCEHGHRCRRLPHHHRRSCHCSDC